MNIKGGCYCGEIRYESKGKVQAPLQCHCRECQYITGGNANVLMIMPLGEFQFVSGKPQEFKRNDIEKGVTRLFCGKCGTAIGTRSPMRPESIILKVGTFDDPSVFNPEIAIFTIDKQKYHHIDVNLKCFDKRP